MNVIAPPTVAGEAVVRSRSGQSILDWDENGSTPVKAYYADPDRMRQAVAALDELGFTIHGAGRCHLYFEGPPDAYMAAFGTEVIYADENGGDQGYIRWRTRSAPHVSAFEPAASEKLNAALRLVTLPGALRPNVNRDLGNLNAFAGQTQPLDRDLLLSEVGETLGTGVPVRLQNGGKFPQATDLESATEKGLSAWSDQLGKMLEFVNADVAASAASGATRPVLECEIPEAGASAPRLGDLLKDFFSRGSNLTTSWVKSDPPEDCWEGGNETRNLYLFAEWFDKHALGDLKNGAGLLQGIAGPQGKVTDISQLPGPYLQRFQQLNGESQKLDKFARDVKWVRVATLDVLIKAVSSMKATDKEVGLCAEQARQLVEWFNGVWDNLQQHKIAALHVAGWHAEMVACAFVSVTAGSVPVSLVGFKTDIWTPTGASGVRKITSYSGGQELADPGVNQREFAAERSKMETDIQGQHLRVIAIGNNRRDEPQKDMPSANSAFFSPSNVILVGGCYPTQIHDWSASDATPGFALQRANAKDASVPDICATTKSDEGGSVIFPSRGYDVVQGRTTREWRTGGGSSLSTPIVAAVCALVWTAFPDLTRDELKACVLDSAEKLGGGQFHFPTVGNAGLVPNSNVVSIGPPLSPPSPPGARRVQLQAALRNAAQVDARKHAAAAKALVSAKGATP